MSKLVKIKPCDNTFFREGNQFSFDISNVIQSKNTPYPSVFFGAIFTAILAYNDEFREKFFYKSRYDHEKILKIGQVYLLNENTKKVYIKAPLDIFINENKKIDFGKFEKNNTKFTSLNYDYFLRSPDGDEYDRVRNYYINIKNMYDSYLKKQSVRLDLIDEDSIFKKDYKVGIGIDKITKNVEEGKLYKIQQTEFIDDVWSYIVEYTIDENYLKDKYENVKVKDLELGYLKLGGENKVCKYNIIDNDRIKEFNFDKLRNVDDEFYKITFITDTYFLENINFFFKNNGMKLLGISNDKPIYIGGYDMKVKGKKGGAVRKMYKGYSAGTVCLIKVDNKLNSENICEIIKQNNKKGFNNCVVLKEEL